MKKHMLPVVSLFIGLFLCLCACDAAPLHRQAALDTRQDDVGEDAMVVQTDDVSDLQPPGPATPAGPADETEDEAADTETENAPEKEKTRLVIAGVGCTNSKLRMVINAFNQQSEDYRISLIDYAYDGASVEQAQMRLQTQILAGKQPDMLLFEDYAEQIYLATNEVVQNVSPLPYISSGMLLDLDEFVQNDPDIDADDFIIADALHEYGGMYLIAPKFKLLAVYTLQETAAQYPNWTLEDYLEIQDSLRPEQDMFYGITPEQFLWFVGSRYIQDAIDIETATCDFDNPQFISLLETACHVNSYDTDEKHVQSDRSFKSAQEMVANGELMFSIVELRSAADISFDSFNAGGIRVWYGEGENPYANKGMGERMAYVGPPTPDGSNGMYVELMMPLGICAGTEQADGCWEFIKFMLQNPIYQTYCDGTPVLESQLADNFASIQKFSERIKWTTSEADLDTLVEAARGCQAMSFYDEDIMAIVEEEAAGVLTGNITAEQAAERVQNRASILVMERYG